MLSAHHRCVFTLEQPVYNPKALTDSLSKAVQWARQKGIPVIYVQHENETFLKKNIADWDIIDAIAPQG